MAQIVIGTTPTIIYKFSIVDPQDFIAAKLTIKNKNSILFKKELTDATIGEDSISWTLTQEETLQLAGKTCAMMLNWKTEDGTRGASEEVLVTGVNNHIREVI